jgi:hypothetical protein
MQGNLWGVGTVVTGGVQLCYTFLRNVVLHASVQYNLLVCCSYRVIFYCNYDVDVKCSCCGIMLVFDVMYKKVLPYIVMMVPVIIVFYYFTISVWYLGCI